MNSSRFAVRVAASFVLTLFLMLFAPGHAFAFTWAGGTAHFTASTTSTYSNTYNGNILTASYSDGYSTPSVAVTYPDSSTKTFYMTLDHTSGATSYWTYDAVFPANYKQTAQGYSVSITTTHTVSSSQILYDSHGNYIPNGYGGYQYYSTSNSSTVGLGGGNYTVDAYVLPVISNVTLTPSALPVVSSTLSASATVTSGSTAVNYVRAELDRDGAYYTSGNMTASGSTYSTSFSIPTNSDKTNAHTWTVVLYAYDVQSRAAVPVTSQADVQPADIIPTVSDITLSPNPLPVVSTTLSVSATVTAGNSGISYVRAELDRDGAYSTGGNMTANGGTYSISFSIPTNTDKVNAHTWTVVFYAYDNAGNYNLIRSPNDVQPADIIPTVSDITLSPNPLPVVSTTLSVSATVTAGNSGISYVRAELDRDGAYSTGGNMTANGGTYSISFSIPTNTSLTKAHSWTVVFYAYDNAGNVTPVTSQADVQPNDTVPTISNLVVSPTSLPVLSSTLLVYANVAPGNSPVQEVYAELDEDGKKIQTVYYNSGGIVRSGTTYGTLFSIPINTSKLPHTWTVIFYAYDVIGYAAIPLASQDIIQSTDIPPTISRTSLTPYFLSVYGDILSFKATVTPGGTNITSVTADAYRDSTAYAHLSSLATDNDTVYSGSFLIPVNPDKTTMRNWTVVVTATDTSGNSTQVTLGPSVQGTDDLEIVYATLTPSALPYTGGLLTVDALGADPTNITGITSNLYKDGQPYSSDSSTLPPGELMTYTVKTTIPANMDNVSHNWTAVVTFTNGAGVMISRSLGPSVQAAAPLATVSGQVILEGVADLSALSPDALGTLHVSFRPSGSTAIAYAADVALTPVGSGRSNGTYAVSGVPFGTYDVLIKGSKQLQVLESGIAVQGATTIADVPTLLAGDADDSNAVNFDDFLILLNAFGSDAVVSGSGYDAAADFNYDGKINFDDFLLLLNNFGAAGDS